MRIAVCRPQQPFTRGGAEIFADLLVEQLRVRGHDAEIVALPFQTWPNEAYLTAGVLWRLVDLSPYELVVATKFPSYVVEHENKVVWLIHQLRQAYELHGTEYGQFGDSVPDQAIRERIEQIDRYALGQARRLFATSANVAGRLESSTGLRAEVMPHPPQELDYRCERYDPFVLSVGRLDAWKRVELLIEAARLEPTIELVIAGDGPDRERLEELAGGLGDRVRFLGRVSEGELAALYATCRAVAYVPVDEDFGMVPLEAFRSCKPVVTAGDSGGPLEFVRAEETGWVAEPDAASLAAALREALEDEALARRYGEAGLPAAEAISWDGAIARLLG
jgi:glycosyltransferase involved in cell wall biosynthesis